MSEWDKLKEYKFLTAFNKDLYIEDFMTQVWAVGDKLQKDLIFWKDACFEMQTYKDGLYDKLEAIREWLIDESFQEFRDNVPTHADYPRFNTFYDVHDDWIGDFFDWLEKCPFKKLAIQGSDEVSEK